MFPQTLWVRDTFAWKEQYCGTTCSIYANFNKYMQPQYFSGHHGWEPIHQMEICQS